MFSSKCTTVCPRNFTKFELKARLPSNFFKSVVLAAITEVRLSYNFFEIWFFVSSPRYISIPISSLGHLSCDEFFEPIQFNLSSFHSSSIARIFAVTDLTVLSSHFVFFFRFSFFIFFKHCLFFLVVLGLTFFCFCW